MGHFAGKLAWRCRRASLVIAPRLRSRTPTSFEAAIIAGAAGAAGAAAAIAAIATQESAATAGGDNTRNIAIIVHGGAYAIPDAIAGASVCGCEAAAAAGYDVLAAGGSAMDAVEAAVRMLETDPTFDAGTGSVLNADGAVEMDAIVMDGATLDVGAVAGVSSVHHPVSLARAVLERTPHVMLAGMGADRFARESGFPEATAADLVTDEARKEWERFKSYGGRGGTTATLFSGSGSAPLGHDTVGAVALDAAGHIAAATSTGGITMKRVGRVGDSPLAGAGAHADDTTAAASCTGHGESIVRVVLAKAVTDAAPRLGPAAAARAGVETMRSRVGGCGGVIVVAPGGAVGVAFSTERMCWASRQRLGGSEGAPLVRSGIEEADLPG